MKRKAEEDTARAALDALERRKSERARLANYMREGWAAPKQIHIGREVLIRELGEGDENALPWPEKTPGGGSNECRDSVPAGVEDRKRVLQAAQHNGRGVWLGRCNRKGREESGDTVPVAQAGRNRGGFDAEGHKRGGETKGPESEGPHVIRGGQEVELRSAADRGSAQGRVRSDRAPRECDKAHRQEGSLGRMVSEGASVSEGRTSEGNGGNEYEVVGGTTREKKEWPGKIGTGGTEEVVERHRRPRWNTRVIQEYGTAKLLKARGWERSKAVRLRVGDGADLMVKDEGRKGNDCEVEGKGKDGNRGQASGGGVREGPTLAARESPWVM